MTDSLDRGLAALRGELHDLHAPAGLESALVARFRRQHHGTAPRPRFWWMPPLALAASIALATWMIRASHAPEPIIVENYRAAAQDNEPFLALRPMERVALEPGARVVTTEFPRALLADWGMPVSPERAGEPVRAEMIYSADGEPVAVRLIQ
jgi:hypothetical protein